MEKNSSGYAKLLVTLEKFVGSINKISITWNSWPGLLMKRRHTKDTWFMPIRVTAGAPVVNGNERLHLRPFSGSHNTQAPLRNIAIVKA